MLLHTKTFAYRIFYKKLLCIKAFKHRNFYSLKPTFSTQTLLRTEALTYIPWRCRGFCTQNLLRTEAIYTQTLLYTEAFTQKLFRRRQTLLHRSFFHRSFCTEALRHRSFSTMKFLHTESLTHRNKLFTRRRFCTRKLLHRSFLDTDAHKGFYTEAFSQELFTRRCFCTQKLLHRIF